MLWTGTQHYYLYLLQKRANVAEADSARWTAGRKMLRLRILRPMETDIACGTSYRKTRKDQDPSLFIISMMHSGIKSN